MLIHCRLQLFNVIEAFLSTWDVIDIKSFYNAARSACGIRLRKELVAMAACSLASGHLSIQHLSLIHISEPTRPY